MTTGKTIALTRQTFVGKVISLIFNMLSRLVITFLPRSKHLLISWLQSPSAVILEPRKMKSAIVSTVSPPICHQVMGLDAMIFVFWMLSFKPTFSLSSFTFIKKLFSSSPLSAMVLILFNSNIETQSMAGCHNCELHRCSSYYAIYKRLTDEILTTMHTLIVQWDWQKT